MNHTCMTQVFDMQTEISQLKASSGLPQELIKVLRRGFARHKNNLLSAFDQRERGVSEDAPIRRARSKLRSEKERRRLGKSAERDNHKNDMMNMGLENIAQQMDRMHELD